MGFLLPALTEAKFSNQRDVVLNERRQNYENRPYGLAAMAMLAALFPPDHPYHWTTIGEIADLHAARLDDVHAFFRRYYHPANASLALAGDIDPDAGARARRARTSSRSRPAERVAPVARRRRARRRDAPSPRGPRRAAASVHVLAHAGDVRAGRRRSRSRGGPAGQRQDVAPVPAPGVRRADRHRCVGVAELARDWRLHADHGDRRAGPRAAGARARDPRGARAARGRRTDRRRDRARPRAGRIAVRLPAPDRRRFRRQVRSAERLQRVHRRSRPTSITTSSATTRHAGSLRAAVER